MTSITSFFIPDTVNSGVNFTMEATSSKAGTIVYSLSQAATVTFGDGKKEIEKSVAAHGTDETTTSLVGSAAIITITATLKNETDGNSRDIFLEQ